MKISDVLNFYPNEAIRLELIGDYLSGKASGPFCEPEKISTILGIVKTESGVSKVTLWDCFSQRSRSWNSRQNCEICIVTYTCSWLLLGQHLTDKEYKAFSRIRVSFPYFGNWYRANEIQFDAEDDSTAIFKTTQAPKARPQKFKLNDTQSLSLFGHSFHYDLRPHQKCLIEPSFVEFETTAKSDFYDLLINAGWFRDLYSFAAMTEMPFSEIYLYEEEDVDFRCVLFYV